MRPAYSDFNELPFIDKELIVVLASGDEYLGANGSFEATTLFGCADEPILI